jgi:hypothetical protein
MRRPMILALVILSLVGCMGGILAAQDTTATLKQLNELLARYCSNTPVLNLAADGTVLRKDRNGATMTFSFRDIGELTIDLSGVSPDVPDVQGHVLLPCKDGKSCVEWSPGAGAAKTTGKMVVFSITPGTPTGHQALKLFKDLQAALRQTESREEEKQKIAQVIHTVIGWAKDKNLDLLFSAIASDEDYISVTPGRRVIKSFEDVKQNVPFWMSPDFKYVRHELKDLEIKFARCGEVAWFYCILDDINTYRGEPASWVNARWTGVVEKRDGRWVVVQQHFSFAGENKSH